VNTVQESALAKTLDRRLAWIIAMLLGAVVASAASALATSSSAVHHAAARPAAVVVTAVDIVPPTPVSVTFAKPTPPSTPKPVAQTTTVAPAPVAKPARTQPVRSQPVSALCTGSGWQQRRGQAAVGSLLHPVPNGVTLTFLPGGGALKGMTYYDRHHVDVFVGSCSGESDALLRHVVAHEMGHAWDSLHMSDALRADYLSARGIPAGTPWFGCNGCQDFATPAGDFAETYAQWQRGASDSRSMMAAPATSAQLADLGARFFS
jgi:hypothetical protein